MFIKPYSEKWITRFDTIDSEIMVLVNLVEGCDSLSKDSLGVVHKWRHPIFDIFDYSSPHSNTF